MLGRALEASPPIHAKEKNSGHIAERLEYNAAPHGALSCCNAPICDLRSTVAPESGQIARVRPSNAQVPSAGAVPPPAPVCGLAGRASNPSAGSDVNGGFSSPFRHRPVWARLTAAGAVVRPNPRPSLSSWLITAESQMTLRGRTFAQRARDVS
jgi:hypothetical protein